MASRAERRRRERCAHARVAAERPAPPRPAAVETGPRVVRPIDDDAELAREAEAERKRAHKVDGLTWLRDRGRLTREQYETGRWYGGEERWALIEGGAAIGSHLEIRPRGAGGGGLAELAPAHMIADARANVDKVRGWLADQADKITLLSLICARGFHPRDISPVQREAEQIETALRTCLDIVHGQLRRERLEAERRREEAASQV